MKQILPAFLLILCLILGSCATKAPVLQTEPAVAMAVETIQVRDYASDLKLDMNSATLKAEATVKSYIDGDTTHFYVPSSVSENGVLKARYLAINTPESTGKIEEYGKKASTFTRQKLSGAQSIIIESDNGAWNLDSTGSRTLAWVWYRNSESEDYRNLNIEILQNGLAIASSSANNRYGATAVAAIAQAKSQKLNIYSGQRDPDFFYGEAVELTLKELRCNIQDYVGMKVAFEGVITANSSNSVYIEDRDEETDIVYGMTIYYGFGLSGEGLDILSVGNRSRIVGTVQYYEAGGSYQVSGLSYRQMKPNDPNNIQCISRGNEPYYTPLTASRMLGSVEVEGTEHLYWQLAMNSTVCMKALKVSDAYMTSNEDSSSYGAMTLTAMAPEGLEVTVRVVALYDEQKSLLGPDYYIGRSIDVYGIIDSFDSKPQIKVLSKDKLIFND
ncbi:MAG: thermonuclease family protein [Sphaerochaetaceae bacterium]|nr:thermonuclease family protein [Sphaerochaetaceae bacterium]